MLAAVATDLPPMGLRLPLWSVRPVALTLPSVPAIAENAGVRGPSFLGYVVRWSLPILVPSFVVLTVAVH